MKKLLAFLNINTYSIVAISLLSSFLTLRYNLQLHHNFALLGLFIVFPLVKSLQFAFKRREKAIEYISLFKSALTTVDQSIQHSKKTSSEVKLAGSKVILQISDVVLNYLKTGQPGTHDVYSHLNNVSKFLHDYKDEIPNKTTTVILRHMKDVQTSANYLVALTQHRTVLVLRVFALVFIFIFTLIQAPLINFTFEQSSPLVYSITIFTSLVLITLYNVQHQLEDPFDQIGYDDISIDEFRVVLTASKSYK